MAKFYGQIKGRAKSRATREGSLDSGLRVSAQSYDGSIAIELSYIGEQLMIEVDASERSEFNRSDMTRVWSGPFVELIDTLIFAYRSRDE